ncbi:AAA family ATPase [bacterium]|nr:AAA family ATPase [bacterium]
MNDYPRPFAGREPEDGRIIAVGGAKGGIGKSLVTSNLAVLLSSRGFSTAVVDLDLGGANLHLYLGEKTLQRNLHHFLNKEAELQDILIETRFGPWLIGGDNSELGAANIPFAQKLKLLRTLKRLDVDYILLDLGSNISYNVLDFFLAADYPIVIATPEPAAYLGAYRFIKVALYRKLDRLFGVESEFYTHRAPSLERLIRTAIGRGELRVRRIEQLLELVQAEQPRNLAFMQSVLDSFRPMLVMNKVPADQDTVQIVQSIQDSCRDMLSVKMDFLGYLPSSPDFERSARELTPVSASDPEGEPAAALAALIE